MQSKKLKKIDTSSSAKQQYSTANIMTKYARDTSVNSSYVCVAWTDRRQSTIGNRPARFQ